MSKTVLLADDSVTIQKVVELTFLDEDFRVVSVADGAEAIGRLDEVRPDLVIADVHMPGADGYEVAQAVARSRPGTPVLLLVGTFEVFEADRAAAVGAAGHLKKPFDSQELLRRVKDLLAGTPATAETPGYETVGPGAAVAIATPSEPSWSAVDETPARDFEPLPDLEATPGFETALPAAFEPLPELPLPAPAASAAVASPAAGRVDTAVTAGANGGLSDSDVDRIARRVIELLGDDVLREVAWEVVPDLAEVLLKARIRELEASVE